MSLYLWIADKDLREEMRSHLSTRRTTDSGVDLVCPPMTLDFSQSMLAAEIRTGIVAAAKTVHGAPAPYLLLARSSLSLTPLRMSNQIGLADAGYRGELIARVDNMGKNTTYEIPRGRRLFQIVQHDWMPFQNVYIVNSIDHLPLAPDNRGSGGFGSTG